MKKIIQFSFGLLLMSVLLQSCDKTVAKIVLNEDLEYVVEVLGDAEEFFEPVAGIYKVVEKDDKFQVTIEFEKTKDVSNKEYFAEWFDLLPADKDDNYIKVNDKNVEFQAENKTSVVQDLLKAKVGDKVKVTFSYLPADKLLKQELSERIYSCSVSLSLEEGEDDSEDDDEEIVDSKSSANWDKVLDEYESYVNQYIALVKKAKSGDISAMSEYEEMLEIAQSFADELKDADDKMTAEQISRYTKITAKMAQAAN